MSEKRHATLDAKSTDTYQRTKKAREEREKQISEGKRIRENLLLNAINLVSVNKGILPFQVFTIHVRSKLFFFTFPPSMWD